MNCPNCGTKITSMYKKDYDRWAQVASVSNEHTHWIGHQIKGTGIYCQDHHCRTPMFTFDSPERTLTEYLMETAL